MTFFHKYFCIYNYFSDLSPNDANRKFIACLDPSQKLKKSSSVLKGETGFIKQLKKWLGEKCKWNLCYRASRDGWRAQDFHRYCDNKGPTVVLVKVSNYIFGGYTDENWQGW